MFRAIICSLLMCKMIQSEKNTTADLNDVTSDGNAGTRYLHLIRESSGCNIFACLLHLCYLNPLSVTYPGKRGGNVTSQNKAGVPMPVSLQDRHVSDV